MEILMRRLVRLVTSRLILICTVWKCSLYRVEHENDLLVCGDCQTNFPLREITKFIRHKVNKCNKENVQNDHEQFDDDADPDETYIGTKQTPISAPISRKESVDGISKELVAESTTEAKVDEVTVSVADDDVEQPKPNRRPFQIKLVDAESNTIHSEPLKFTCETCRKTFGSAWSLLQHAQREHGMKIYVPASKDSPAQSPRGSGPSIPQAKLRSESHCRDRDKDKNQDISKHNKDPNHERERNHSDSIEPHRTTSSVGSTSSGEGPHQANHHSPNNPFMFPRLPFADGRHPLSPLSGLSPLNRSPGDMRIDGFPADHFLHRGAGIPNIFGMPAFEHTSPSFHPYDRSHARAGMTLDDFYSQRLRQLASSTSPSPVRKHTPPFSQSSNPLAAHAGMFASVTPPATTSTSSDADKRHDGTRSLTPPVNCKSCEFCGKSFRFQSNLIVHRRSHTGEKPYKCPVCPHACTQASKLKRHMKTHAAMKPHTMSSNMSSEANASEGSLASSSSTPDSNKAENNEDDDDDDDAEDEDEDDEEEEIDEEEDMAILALQLAEYKRRSESQENKEQMNEGKMTTPKSELAARLFDRRIEQTIANELSKDAINAKDKSSLLSEVMERTGLRAIPNYNEALKQALAESSKTDSSSNKVLQKLDSYDVYTSNKKNEDEKVIENKSLKREKPDDSIMSISKMIKKEPPEKSGTPPVSAPVPRMNNIENFYPPALSNLWFPTPPPDFFRTFSSALPRFSIDRVGEIAAHNGFNTASTPDSDNPLANFSNAATPTSNSLHTNNALQTNGMAGVSAALGASGTPPQRNKMNRDTCEYCGKIFKNCSNLTVHRRSHTGEKPYKCLLCNYACAQSSKLTRHMKTHGRFGKDVYKCKFCGMPFSVPSTLEKHMKKCLENSNAVLDGDTDQSNSDGASVSDVPSSANVTPLMMSLPTTPVSLVVPNTPTFGSMPFSIANTLENQMRKCFENNNPPMDMTRDADRLSSDVSKLNRNDSQEKLGMTPSSATSPRLNNIDNFYPVTALSHMTLPTAQLSLPTTPLSLTTTAAVSLSTASASLPMPLVVPSSKFPTMPFPIGSSLERQMQKYMENSDAVLDGEYKNINYSNPKSFPTSVNASSSAMPAMVRSLSSSTPMSLPTSFSEHKHNMDYSVPKSFPTSVNASSSAMLAMVRSLSSSIPMSLPTSFSEHKHNMDYSVPKSFPTSVNASSSAMPAMVRSLSSSTPMSLPTSFSEHKHNMDYSVPKSFSVTPSLSVPEIVRSSAPSMSSPPAGLSLSLPLAGLAPGLATGLTPRLSESLTPGLNSKLGCASPTSI